MKTAWPAIALIATLAVKNDLGGRFTFFVKRPPRSISQSTTLAADLDRIFGDAALTRALIGVRIESLRDGQLLYSRDSAKLVMPASNMKLLTMSVAADKLGWDFTYRTRLERSGTIADGTLHGDLIVIGSGDPSISAQDFASAPLFGEWADALRQAGIHRVDGRLIGDDGYFDDEGLGAGWAWDYLGAGYAAPSGALSYNENVAVIRLWPGKTAGEAARVELSPPGHLLRVKSDVITGAAGSAANVDLLRLPGSPDLTIRGSVPAGGSAVIRTTAVDNPTRFFIEDLRLALAARGITITGGGWDIDDLTAPVPSTGRQVVATRESAPLSSLAAYFLKASQNFYGEQILKTVGKVAGQGGTTAAGRDVVRATLGGWGIPADAFVMYDGSGLSRYNYVSADTIVGILKHVWNDAKMRGPFLAALPVAAHDGTLDTRMKGTILDAHVQAKTGTISNVRSLSGFLETKSGEKIVFSMIANNFTVPSSQIDAIAERALARLAER